MQNLTIFCLFCDIANEALNHTTLPEYSEKLPCLLHIWHQREKIQVFCQKKNLRILEKVQVFKILSPLGEYSDKY